MWKASNKMELQHLIYPRTLNIVRRCEVTQYAAEQSKDTPEAKTETKWSCESADITYRICSRNLRTFFPILAAENRGV